MLPRRTVCVTVLTMLAFACAKKDPPLGADTASQNSPNAIAATPGRASLGAGEDRLAVGGSEVWYKKSGGGPGIPVILIHGGPGLSSYYLKPLETLGDERTVIRYDQGGSGKSGTMTDTTKMTIPHFVEELEALRSHLGYDKVHLVGHSWGTTLALEYYRMHPEHVASLTMASAFLDLPQWQRHTRELLKTLPDSLQRVVKAREAEKKFDSPDYRAAIEAFYSKYLWLHPDKANQDSIGPQMNQTLYTYMQGPSEFTITGTLKDYNSTPFLKSVKVPTLFTVGDVDEADPVYVRKQAAMVPGGKVFVIPNAAHIGTWDNPTAMTAAIRAHLKAADSSPVSK